MYFLGIDGGGSKTTAALVDETGQLIAKHTGGPSNPLSVSLETIERTLENLLEQFRNGHADKFKRIKSVCAGIAGTENSNSKNDLLDILKSKFSEETYVQLCHDALTALYTGTNGAPGIVNIAGTGSITFGITPDKKVVRSGGWGYLLDHAGSGFGIGKLALQKAFESYDGFLPATLLTERILKRFDVASPPELIPYIYGSDTSRSRIASICEDVFVAMRSGDEIAKGIVDEAAEEMSRNIGHLITQHFQHTAEPKVVLTGSVYKSSDVLLPLLYKNLQSGVLLITPPSPPVAGSIIESYQSIFGKCPESFIKTLHHSFSEGESV